MEKRKGIITRIGEFMDTCRAEHQTSVYTPSSKHKHLDRLRWFIPNGGTLISVAALLLTQSLWAQPFVALNAPGPSATTVNYQGQLSDNAGAPLNGSYAMTFALCDAMTGGALIWGPEAHPAVPVSNGLFNVGLGSLTSGGIPIGVWNGDRYLEITIGGETLAPRELIRSVPIAGMALTVPDGAIGTNQIVDGAVTSAKLAPTIVVNDDYAVVTTSNKDSFAPLQSVTVNVDQISHLIVLWQSNASNDTDGFGGDFVVYIDGAPVTLLRAHFQDQANLVQPINITGVIQNVTPGAHSVEVWWQARYGGTLTDWMKHLSVVVVGQ